MTNELGNRTFNGDLDLDELILLNVVKIKDTNNILSQYIMIRHKEKQLWTFRNTVI